MRKLIIFMLVMAYSGILYAGESKTFLTIYNDDLALVKQVREVSIPKGNTTIKFVDVASAIDPTSVHFKSLTAPEDVVILEQNYQYDLVTVAKLLEKYVDNQVTITTKESGVYSGLLLSAQNGDAILRQDAGGVIVLKANTIYTVSFPSLPEGLITRPTLVWMLENNAKKDQKVEVTYLTSKIKWHAEYVALVDQKDENLELSGWVSIDNRSGATYKNAKLKLVAGDVNRVKPKRQMMEARSDMVYKMAAAAPQFKEKAFFEYHLYTLQRPATVKDREIKQVSLFPTASTRVKKIYTFNGARYGKKVSVNIEFRNSKDAGLGMPLPQGIIRVYKKDSDKSLEFIGEDQIDHTPKDEKVRLYLGNAFDIVGERVKKDTKKISGRAKKEAYSIKIRNHKKEPVVVTVVESFYGDWEIIKSSHKHRKKDASTAEFDLLIPKYGETELTFTVLLQW